MSKEGTADADAPEDHVIDGVGDDVVIGEELPLRGKVDGELDGDVTGITVESMEGVVEEDGDDNGVVVKELKVVGEDVGAIVPVVERVGVRDGVPVIICVVAIVGVRVGEPPTVTEFEAVRVIDGVGDAVCDRVGVIVGDCVCEFIVPVLDGETVGVGDTTTTPPLLRDLVGDRDGVRDGEIDAVGVDVRDGETDAVGVNFLDGETDAVGVV